MKIEIDEKGGIYCDGVTCAAISWGTDFCLGCPLKVVFETMYANCDPLKCRKIVCAGCEYKNLYKGLVPE